MRIYPFAARCSIFLAFSIFLPDSSMILATLSYPKDDAYAVAKAWDMSRSCLHLSSFGLTSSTHLVRNSSVAFVRRARFSTHQGLCGAEEKLVLPVKLQGKSSQRSLVKERRLRNTHARYTREPRFAITWRTVVLFWVTGQSAE